MVRGWNDDSAAKNTAVLPEDPGVINSISRTDTGQSVLTFVYTRNTLGPQVNMYTNRSYTLQ